MGEYGASCFYTFSDGSRDVEKAVWDQERVGMLCTRSESFAAWKKALLKLCRKNSRCTFEVKKNYEEFMNRVTQAIQ
jgi:hypothetical protein